MRQWLRALSLFVLCAALFSLPAWFVGDKAAIGRPSGDVWRNLWLQWAAAESWFAGGPPLSHFSLLVDPAGANVRARIGNVVWPVLVAPLGFGYGPIVAANAGLAIVLFLNAVCAYLFLRRWLNSPAAALPVALAYAFGAYSMNEAAAGRPAAAGVFAVPLAAWAGARAYEKLSPARLALLAAALALAAFWEPWRATGAAGNGAVDSLPYFLILLALLSLPIRDRRQTMLWLGAAVVLWLTAYRFGPTPLLPAAYLALAVSAGLALQAMFTRLDLGEARERPLVSFFALLALAASFFRVPHPIAPVDLPAPYAAIAGDARGAVLELPAHAKTSINAHNLFFQTAHRRPALVARIFDDQPEGFPPAAVAAAPGLAGLGRWPMDPATLDGIDPSTLRAGLAALGVRWVALHTDAIPEISRELFSFWFTQTFGAPIGQSKAMTLFELR
jgi:hypothetical protein